MTQKAINYGIVLYQLGISQDMVEKKTFFEQAEEARQELEEGKTAAESQNMDDVLLRNTQDHEEQ